MPEEFGQLHDYSLVVFFVGHALIKAQYLGYDVLVAGPRDDGIVEFKAGYLHQDIDHSRTLRHCGLFCRGRHVCKRNVMSRKTAKYVISGR
jgi:hypothetical protein